MLFDANKIYSIEKDISKLLTSFSYKDRCACILRSPCFIPLFKEEKVTKLLPNKCKVYSIKQVVNGERKKEEKGLTQKISKKLISTILGFIPGVGEIISIILPIIEIAQDIYNENKINEIEKELSGRWRKHKKTKRVKSIIYANDIATLSQKELTCLQVVSFLIAQNYINDTAILIIQNLETPVPYLSNSKIIKEYKIDEILADNINKTDPSVSNNKTILDIIGIDFVHHLNAVIDQEPTHDQTIESIINSILKEKKVVANIELERFLKTCSLLFEQFELKDVEYVAKLQDNKEYQQLFNQARNSEIIQCLNMQKFYFLQPFLREFFQQRNHIFPSEFYDNVYAYLQTTYPHSYGDLAIAASLLLSDDNEILASSLLAFYHSSYCLSKYKLDKIIEILNNNSLGKLILQINKLYNESNYSNNSAVTICNMAINMLRNYHIRVAAKLAALSFIARLFYELNEPQVKLIEISTYYRELLAQIHILSGDIKDEAFITNWNYALDYIAFSTCIEDDFSTHNIVQRLSTKFNKIDPSHISIDKYLKYLQLGNAIFPQDPLEAKILLSKGYSYSKDIPYIHQLFTVNYSANLISEGMYEDALRELKPLQNKKSICNSIKLSVENNYQIAGYLSKKISGKAAIKALASYYSEDGVSDYCICMNNYTSMRIMNGEKELYNDISVCNNIMQANDLYHSFYARHNLIVIYFLMKDPTFWNVLKITKVPYLLKGYESLYLEKLEFFKNNFGKDWNINQITDALIEYLQKSIAHHDTSNFYQLPVLFGMIERWFE